MAKSLSPLYRESISKINGYDKLLLTALYKEAGQEIVTGNEGFEFLDKTLYKIDKAFTTGIKNVMSFFQTTNILIEDIMVYKTKTPSITNLHKLRPTLIRKSNELKFYKIEKRKVPVLLGLKLTFKELYELLNSNSGYVKGLKDSMLRFELFLDNLIDSKKGSININVDKDEVSALHKNVDNINKSLDTVTNDKILKDRLELKKVVRDFRELISVTNDSLKLGSVYNMEKLEHIYELNERLNGKLELLYNVFKSKSGEVSKDEIKQISSYIGSMAKMLTAVAFLFYLYYQLIDQLVAVIRILDLEETDTSIVDKIGMTFKDSYNVLLNAFK